MAIARKNSIKKNKKPGRKTRVVIRRGGSRKMNLKGGAFAAAGHAHEEEELPDYDAVVHATQESAAQALLELAQREEANIIHPGDPQPEGEEEDLEQQLREFLDRGVKGGHIAHPSNGGNPATMHINHVARTIAKRIRTPGSISEDMLNTFLSDEYTKLYDYYLSLIGQSRSTDEKPEEENERILTPILKYLSNLGTGAVEVCKIAGRSTISAARCTRDSAKSAYEYIKEKGSALITSFTAVQIVEFLIHCGLSITLIYFIITTIIPMLIAGGMSLVGSLLYIIQYLTGLTLAGGAVVAGAAVNNPNTAFVTLIVLNAVRKRYADEAFIKNAAQRVEIEQRYNRVKEALQGSLQRIYEQEEYMDGRLAMSDEILAAIANAQRIGGQVAIDFSSLSPEAVTILEAAIQGIPINATPTQAAEHVITYVKNTVERASNGQSFSAACIALHYLKNSGNYMSDAYRRMVKNISKTLVSTVKRLEKIGKERQRREQAMANAARAAPRQFKFDTRKYNDLYPNRSRNSSRNMNNNSYSSSFRAYRDDDELKSKLEELEQFIAKGNDVEVDIKGNMSAGRISFPRKLENIYDLKFLIGKLDIKEYEFPNIYKLAKKYGAIRESSGGARKIRGTRKNLRIKSRNSNKNKNKKRVSKKRNSRK